MRQPKFIGFFTPSRRGFSLIEMLIAIGILVALTAIALPMILLAKKRGFETRTRSDLALIGMALEAYKDANSGDYPRFDDDNSNDALNYQQDRGARLLCRALLSPGPMTLTTAQSKIGFDASNATEGAPDGADGPGFRLRPSIPLVNGVAYGKVYGPYLDASKFRLGNPAAPLSNGVPNWDSVYFKDATILDQNGNSILYFPGLTSASPAVAYVQYLGPPAPPLTAPAVRSFYNLYDNNHYGSSASGTGNYILYWKQAAFILGDRNLDGVITSTSPIESATTTLPYLLWTAGSDGIFGFPGLDSSGVPIDPTTPPQQILKTDDITNFDIPADLRK